MPHFVQVNTAITVRFGQQNVRLRAGQIVDGNLGQFIVDRASGVDCVAVEAPAEAVPEPEPVTPEPSVDLSPTPDRKA
jgi:hypothetical protein